MKRLEFCCICELAEIMNNYIEANAIVDDEYPVVSAYVNYEEAKSLVETLILLGNPIGNIIELEDYEMSYYDKEYVIYLTKDGVTSEKVYRENKYYYGGGDISFVHEDCNSKLLNYIDSKTICEFGVIDSCDDCEERERNECCDKNKKCLCGCNGYTDDGIECDIKSDDDGYSITVRCNLDADETMKVINDMEYRMEHMNNMFREMDNFIKYYSDYN